MMPEAARQTELPPPPGDDTEIAIFELALSLPEADREGYLREACRHSPDTYQRVCERLSWENRMGGFLKEPLFPRADADQDFHPGQLVAGRFEIVRRAGEGGMAVVYEALDHKSEQRVAVKFPKHAFRKRLLRELKSALQVSHSNICRVHEIHTTATDNGELDFLTMEFLDGETLADRLCRQPRPSLEEVREIAAQLCAGLAAAHARNIVHGDLKPGNIILAKDEHGARRAVITDFGLAQGIRPLGSSSLRSLRGTPDFIAPELWRGAQPSKASDVYALGVVLYELIAGLRPFERLATAMDPGSRPEPLRRFAPKLPHAWNDAIMSCLAPLPAERPSELHSLLAVEPRPSRRARWVAAAAAALCLAAGVPYVFDATRNPPLPETIRLAVLPPDADAETSTIANGIAIDLSTRLRRTGRGRIVTIVPLAHAMRYHVQSVDDAAPILGATHVLRLRSRRVDAAVTVGLTVYDAASRRIVRSLPPQPLDSIAGGFAQRAAVEISSAFQSEVIARESRIHPAAYLDYVAALYHLRQAPNVHQATALLDRASAADAASPLIPLAHGEAAILEYRRTRQPAALDRAAASLETARRLGGAEVSISLGAATLHEASGRLEAALLAYDEALSREPLNATAWRAKAAIFAQLKRPNQEAEAIQKAIALQPGSFPPVLELGLLFYRQGRYSEAQRELSRVTELAPKLWEGHHNLAAVYTDTAQYQLAEREFLAALNLSRAPETLAGLGALMSYQKRHPESAYYYEQAVAAGPEDSLLLSNLGDAYRRTGRADESRRAYTRALVAANRDLAANPADALARSFIAYLSVRLGRLREGEAAFNQALRDAPNDVKIRRRGVAIYELLRRREVALSLLAEAPLSLFDEISRHPDLSLFSEDLRFRNLKDALTQKPKD